MNSLYRNNQDRLFDPFYNALKILKKLLTFKLKCDNIYTEKEMKENNMESIKIKERNDKYEKTIGYMIEKGNLAPNKSKASTTHKFLYTLWKVTGVPKQDMNFYENPDGSYDWHSDYELVFIIM